MPSSTNGSAVTTLTGAQILSNSSEWIVFQTEENGTTVFSGFTLQSELFPVLMSFSVNNGMSAGEGGDGFLNFKNSYRLLYLLESFVELDDVRLERCSSGTALTVTGAQSVLLQQIDISSSLFQEIWNVNDVHQMNATSIDVTDSSVGALLTAHNLETVGVSQMVLTGGYLYSHLISVSGENKEVTFENTFIDTQQKWESPRSSNCFLCFTSAGTMVTLTRSTIWIDSDVFLSTRRVIDCEGSLSLEDVDLRGFSAVHFLEAVESLTMRSVILSDIESTESLVHSAGDIMWSNVTVSNLTTLQVILVDGQSHTSTVSLQDIRATNITTTCFVCTKSSFLSSIDIDVVDSQFSWIHLPPNLPDYSLTALWSFSLRSNQSTSLHLDHVITDHIYST